MPTLPVPTTDLNAWAFDLVRALQIRFDTWRRQRVFTSLFFPSPPASITRRIVQQSTFHARIYAVEVEGDVGASSTLTVTLTINGTTTHTVTLNGATTTVRQRTSADGWLGQNATLDLTLSQTVTSWTNVVVTIHYEVFQV